MRNAPDLPRTSQNDDPTGRRRGRTASGGRAAGTSPSSVREFPADRDSAIRLRHQDDPDTVETIIADGGGDVGAQGGNQRTRT